MSFQHSSGDGPLAMIAHPKSYYAKVKEAGIWSFSGSFPFRTL